MHHDTAKKQTPPRLRVLGENLHGQHFFTVVMSKTQETLVNLWDTRTRVPNALSAHEARGLPCEGDARQTTPEAHLKQRI